MIGRQLLTAGTDLSIWMSTQEVKEVVAWMSLYTKTCNFIGQHFMDKNVFIQREQCRPTAQKWKLN